MPTPKSFWRRSVRVTTSFVGFHHWPTAPDTVAFLRDLHRHVFHVAVEVAVTHGDRQVEFFKLKTDVEEILTAHVKPNLEKVRSCSCEDMAEQLARRLSGQHYDVVEVSVSEDGENAGIVKSS